MKRRTLDAAAPAAAGLLLLLLPAAAYGNAGVPVLFAGQGGLVLALVTVLVAVLERPFVSRTGVAPRALLHALVANVLSGILGYFLPDLAMALHVPEPDDFIAAFALLLLATLVLSIASESAYYWLVARRSPRPLRLRWVAVGNAVSLLALLLLNGLLLLAAA